MSLTKPSHPEGEYFARVEAEKRQQLAKEIRKKISEAEKKKLKELHWMHCPKCGMELHPILFKGVTIDRCFHCGGVYLDGGELEKVAGHESGFWESVMSLFKF